MSVFDSGFVLGDGVWEGLRVHKGRIAFLDAISTGCSRAPRRSRWTSGSSREALTRRLYETLDANGMTRRRPYPADGDARLRSTPYQDPRVVDLAARRSSSSPNIRSRCRRSSSRASRLFTVHVRRGDPAVQDPKLNSHSKLNCITACIQAIEAGADEALMLDPHGFVATCNSTHFFIVRKGEVWTSTGDYCLGGITRANVIEICREAGIPVFEKNFSLTDVYGADEAFVTGTFAGVVPVREVDGRQLTDGPRADGRAAAGALQGADRGGRGGAASGPDDPPDRDVVRAAQPLDRDDAQLRQPRRHLRQRRAFLRRLPEDERAPSSDARRR